MVWSYELVYTLFSDFKLRQRHYKPDAASPARANYIVNYFMFLLRLVRVKHLQFWLSVCHTIGTSISCLLNVQVGYDGFKVQCRHDHGFQFSFFPVTVHPLILRQLWASPTPHLFNYFLVRSTTWTVNSFSKFGWVQSSFCIASLRTFISSPHNIFNLLFVNFKVVFVSFSSWISY
jgi:hypothetical protein